MYGVMRAFGNRLVALLALCSLVAGCCTSTRRAAEIDAELREQNLARAEPILRLAAQLQGVTLLPNRPQMLGFTPLCATPETTLRPRPGYCVLYSGQVLSATGNLGDVYQLLDAEGKPHTAITLGEEHRSARLARRGERLFVLTPRTTYHQVDRRVQCQCGRGPVIVSMSGFIDLGLAFVFDAAPNVEIQSITVPVVEDYVAWDCKQILVRDERGRRPAVTRGETPARPSERSAFRGCGDLPMARCDPTKWGGGLGVRH